MLMLACALTVGCSATTTGRPVPADADGPRPVPASALPDALLGAATVSEIMGASGMVVKDSRVEMFDSSDQFGDPACLVAWMPVEQQVYAAADWTSMIAQTLWDAAGALDHFVIQSLVTFSSRDTARSFFEETAQTWKSCGERSFTASKDGSSETPWTFDKVTDVDSTLWMTQHQDDSVGWGCQRALRVSNNVAVDVLACRFGVGDEAVTIAHGIDTRLPSV